ncbi:MAG TPA: NAD(P)-dependent oxidoreductase [Chthoniobacteraceae bacterium]|nr:NAD(P)-dependent oxidoreductase [Chthoniobacteraceae bacterium]
MKILLTGAAGKLGRAILQTAEGRHEVVGIDSRPGVPGVHVGSCHDLSLLGPLLEGCSAVIHAAALHGGQRCDHSRTEFLEANVVGLQRLLEESVRCGVRRFVFASSLEVLTGRDWKATTGTFDESSPPQPTWIYPATKVFGEILCDMMSREESIETIALRYGRILHREEATRHRREILLPQIIARGVDHLDAAEAALLACERPYCGFRIVNIAPENPFSQEEIDRARHEPLALLEKEWPGSSARLEALGITLRWDDLWPAITTRAAAQVLGWRPRIKFPDYLRFAEDRPPVHHRPAAQYQTVT